MSSDRRFAIWVMGTWGLVWLWQWIWDRGVPESPLIFVGAVLIWTAIVIALRTSDD